VRTTDQRGRNARIARTAMVTVVERVGVDDEATLTVDARS
jgi:hypothetical protein